MAGPPLDRARWPQLSPLLDALMDLAEPQRAERLAALRSVDPALADELLPWLAELAGLDQSLFLQAPALPPPPGGSGQTVGAYTLDQELGRGGMGTVWLAHRTDGRYEGQVAIKFLQTGLHGAAAGARFAREGSILARLAHPHIARLLDAGQLAPAGPGPAQPYLVLEYVAGLPIDQHCQQQRLPLAARLHLFLAVLDAVAHAHNRLILHRDLKPSNILVTAAGEVKLLDFGIAKLLHDVADDQATQQGGAAYTPQYAAPEQLQGGEVTTATDVYALGVLLFQLLGGKHPTALAEGATLDRLRAVVETVPPPVSTVAPAADAAALRGDLDTIVAHALKKQPGERYANAAALAEDLQRHLAHEPISARPDTWAYRSAKFLRRHRVAVGAGSLAALALAATAAVAVHEARQAQQQQAQAEGLIEFMLGDLPAKLKPVGRLDALNAVGDRALAYYAAQTPGSLDAASLGRRARALHLIGEITEQNGRFDEAAQRFAEAAASTGELLARHPDAPEHLFNHSQSEYWVGFIARRRGRSDEAEAAFGRYLALADRLVALDPDKIEWRIEQAYAGQNLGVLRLEAGRPADALQAFERTRAAWQDVVVVRPAMVQDLANTLGWLAKAHEAAHAYDAALAAQQAKLDALARLPDAGRDREVQFLVAIAHLDIGLLHLARGQPDAAVASTQEAVRRSEALVQADDQNLSWLALLASARIALAESALAQRGPAAARPPLADADALVRRLLATAEPQPRWSVNLQGRWLRLRGQLGMPGVAAELPAYLAQMARRVAAGRALEAEQARIVAAVGLVHGDVLQAAGHADGAAQAWQQAGQRLGPGVARRELPALALAARLVLRQGRAQEALALADELASTPYRHPDVLALREELKQGHAAGR
ncbi:MAG: serine/threonine protein kinase [Rubrivivax sp.]|nr:serine/threonine protein kinase [Rubrivivax sp.]